MIVVGITKTRWEQAMAVLVLNASALDRLQKNNAELALITNQPAW
jgi:hypothetical protein